jgi:probable phosphoglycerate mutase
VFAAPLQRTLQTANLIIDEMKLNAVVVPDSSFTEIDYGDDENATEAQVRRRLGVEYAKKHNLSDVSDNEIMEYGAAVIDLWNAKAIVPAGWNVDVERIIASWANFSNNVVADNETALICTSNGIIRFAPHILNNAEEFIANHDLKVATGSVSIFKTVANVWTCAEWNTKP